MINSVEVTTLSRLLTLNNEIHDLRNLLLKMPVPEMAAATAELDGESIGQNVIAELQEQIDRQIRAGLTLFWLGNPVQDEE